MSSFRAIAIIDEDHMADEVQFSNIQVAGLFSMLHYVFIVLLGYLKEVSIPTAVAAFCSAEGVLIITFIVIVYILRKKK